MDTPQTPSPSEPHLTYIEPSSDMAGLIHTLFITRSGEGSSESIMPAYSAQLFAFIEGSAAIQFPESDTHRSSDVTVTAPMLRAAPMTFDGPMRCVGASFTPLGWATFSGLAADKVHDTAFAADTILPSELLESLLDALKAARADQMTLNDYVRAVEDMIRQVCVRAKRKPRADHVALVTRIEEWLGSAFSPAVEDLYGQVDLGQRQVQRLCRRYFGVPPAQLVKRFRAIRAAMLLAHDDLSEELRDEVVGAYFDQAHLIHDIRRYTGRTPRSLSLEPLAQDMLDPEGHGESGRKLLSE